ncbi:MAG: gliding motility-associated C-terminal domain-containing protein [Flavobacteriales bacterium]|nr:gliding motility-associated C-terminal domain-containing protein [Flavobacteriales bacterium]
MKHFYTFSKKIWLLFAIVTMFASQPLFATHAQSADLTYQCLGGNQYQLSLSFYRDCAGVNAPNSVTIDMASVSCNQNFTTTLNQLPGTGIDVTPICSSMQTTCNGGSNPGVEEYIYTGIVNLPANCTDWTFSFTLCCRNNAINTINTPGNENIYVEAMLDNFTYACNSSPVFSNPPVSFPCVGQTSCFNHGAFDVDGDSLYYMMLAPATGPNTTVTYVPGYSAQQPLQSNPAVTFNSANGDICMTPMLQEVTVLAVKVMEYRDGNLIGSVVRDIQLRTVPCTNTLPTLSGINGTGVYSTTVCVGSTLNFTVPSFDPDLNQTVTLAWNNAIPNATFTSNGAQLPTGTFTWTPTAANISPNPYCFTVTVSDDNCPFNGVQVYSFCITVTGFTVNTYSTSANCGASNGSAYANPMGGTGPYSFQWSPNGGNNATAHGLQAGQYTVLVTDANGCTATSTVTVGSGSAPGNLSLSATHVDCYGASTGSITANANGGQPPYTYQWSNGGTTPSIGNLPAGTYWVVVTTGGGCVKSDTITITEPLTPVSAAVTTTNTNCFGSNDGGATVSPSGGTAPYTMVWNTNPAQNGPTATNLPAGTFSVTITDANGCSTDQNFTIASPPPVNINLSTIHHANCAGDQNGSITVNVSGGNGPYSYNWNNNNYPSSPAINGLGAGVYLLTVTDANGCVATNQYTITEPTPVNISVVNSKDISCNGFNDGEIYTSTMGGTPPYTYMWTQTPANTPNVTGLGNGYHVVVATDSHGCWDTASAVINEPSPIATMAMGNDTVCPGQAAGVSAQAFGGVGNYTYYWNNGYTGAAQNVAPPATTTYQVYAVDGNGCIGTTDSVLVLVNDINLVSLSVVPDTNICQGAGYTIGASVSGGIGNYTFNWNNGVGQGQGPFFVTPSSSVNYVVTVTDVCNNSISENITVNVEPLPHVYLMPQTKEHCGAVSFTMQNATSNPAGSTYWWDFGDNSTSSQEAPVHTYNQTGAYPVTLTVTSAFGCVNSDQTYVNATVNTKPKADFEPNPYETTMLNPEITFENFSVDANFYTWNLGDGTTSQIQSPVHEYKDDGTYTITLIASHMNGCKDTAVKEVVIKPEYNFFIPNAFTPNNDGRNDIFTAVGEEITEFNMQIFDRWGELIYETEDLNTGWDGTAKGGNDISMEGVYVYNIQLRDWQGVNHNYVGKVSLLK